MTWVAEQFYRAHHLPVGQAGEAEVAKDVVDSCFLGLLQPFYHHLGGAPERGQARRGPGSSRRSRSLWRLAQCS